MSDYPSAFTPKQIPEAQRITKALMDTKLSELWDADHVQAFCKYAADKNIPIATPGEPTVDEFLTLHAKDDPRVVMFNLLQNFAHHDTQPPHRDGMTTLRGLSYGLGAAAKGAANRESLGPDVQAVNKTRAMVWAHIADGIEELSVLAGIQQEKGDAFRTLGLPRPGEKVTPPPAPTPATIPEQKASAIANKLLETPLSNLWYAAHVQAFVTSAGKQGFQFNNPSGPTIEDFLHVSSSYDSRIRSLAPLRDIAIRKCPDQPLLSNMSGLAAGITADYKDQANQTSLPTALKEELNRRAQVMAEVVHAIDEIRVLMGHINAEDALNLHAMLGIPRPGKQAAPPPVSDEQQRGHEVLKNALSQPLSKIWDNAEAIQMFTKMMRNQHMMKAEEITPTLAHFLEFQAYSERDDTPLKRLLAYGKDPKAVPTDGQLSLALGEIVHKAQLAASDVEQKTLAKGILLGRACDHQGLVALHNAMENMLVAMGKPTLLPKEPPAHLRHLSPELIDGARAYAHDLLYQPLKTMLSRAEIGKLGESKTHLFIPEPGEDPCVKDFLMAQGADIIDSPLHPLMALVQFVEHGEVPSPEQLRDIVAVCTDKERPKEHAKLYQTAMMFTGYIATIMRYDMRGMVPAAPQEPTVHHVRSSVNDWLNANISSILQPDEAAALAKELHLQGALDQGIPLKTGDFLNYLIGHNQQECWPLNLLIDFANHTVHGLPNSDKLADAYKAITTYRGIADLTIEMAPESPAATAARGSIKLLENAQIQLKLMEDMVKYYAEKEKHKTETKTHAPTVKQASPHEKILKYADTRKGKEKAVSSMKELLGMELRRVLNEPLLSHFCKGAKLEKHQTIGDMLTQHIAELRKNGDPEQVADHLENFQKLATTGELPSTQDMRKSAAHFIGILDKADQQDDISTYIIMNMLRDSTNKAALHLDIQLPPSKYGMGALGKAGRGLN
jgi:hypothetical protein